jgi:hypothetical protein
MSIQDLSKEEWIRAMCITYDLGMADLLYIRLSYWQGKNMDNVSKMYGMPMGAIEVICDNRNYKPRKIRI